MKSVLLPGDRLSHLKHRRLLLRVTVKKNILIFEIVFKIFNKTEVL